MINSFHASTDELLARRRFRQNMIFGGFLGLMALIFVVWSFLLYSKPDFEFASLMAVGFTVFALVALPVLVWQNPRFGLGLLVFAACILDMDARMLTHIPTRAIPFFLNLNNVGDTYGTGALAPFKFSPAELVIVMTLLTWLVRTVAMREFRFEKGAFFWPIAAYTLMVFWGFVHGVVTGGDSTMALWEMRAQCYIIVSYLMVTNLVTKKEHVTSLLWLTVLGIGFRSLLGVVAYSKLGGNITDQGILEHEDSLFVNLIYFVAILGLLTKANKPLTLVAWLFTPTCLFLMLENQRRAGIGALAIAFLAVPMMVWVLMPERRKQVAVFTVLFAVFCAAYLPVAWNSSATWAMPARAIKSNSDPSERDAGSNNYRYEEDTDLKFTRDMSPWQGHGFGKPFIQIIPLPAVTTGFLAYFAHNSVLWIWMTLGHFGFFFFIMIIASLLIKGIHLLREVRDPTLQMTGMITILSAIMLYIFGKYDLQFVNYRTMIFMSVWFGLLSAVHRVQKLADEEAGIKALPTAAPTEPMPHTPVWDEDVTDWTETLRRGGAA